MRKPTEKGFASECAARLQHAKVSRALWPSARMTCSAAISAVQHDAAHRAGIDERSVDVRRKRISPPSASISARIFSIIETRRKVPMCGLLT